MIKIFKNIVDKEFSKIKWGKINFNLNNILEKNYKGQRGNLEASIIVKDETLFKD
jgi:hypothetical protein